MQPSSREEQSGGRDARGVPSGSPIRKGFLVAVTESDTLSQQRRHPQKQRSLWNLKRQGPQSHPRSHPALGPWGPQGPSFPPVSPSAPSAAPDQPTASSGWTAAAPGENAESRLGPLVTAGLQPQLDRFLSAGRVPAGLKCLRKTLTPPGNSSQPLSLVSW